MATRNWQPVQYQAVAEPLAVPAAPAVGAGPGAANTGQVIPMRGYVQYQAMAVPIFTPNPGIGWMPGFPVVFGQETVQYQALAAPVPIIAAPATVPGAATWLSYFPDRVPGREPLPIGAYPAQHLDPLPRSPVIAASALSWVPIYMGPPRLPVALQQVLSMATFVFPPTGAPASSWSPVYPDTVGLRQPGLPTAIIPSIFRDVRPIAPALPPLSWAPVFPALPLPLPQPSIRGEVVAPNPQALIVPHGKPRVKKLPPRHYIKVLKPFEAKRLRPDDHTKDLDLS